MSKLLKSLRRQQMTCSRCKGRKTIGAGYKRRTCPQCGGIGEANQRSTKVGPIVVAGMIFCLFLLYIIASLTAKSASANSSENIISLEQSDDISIPTFDIKVEIISGTEGSEIQEQGGECHVSQSYPEGIMQWCELITAAAHKYGIPSDMIAAVMSQESGGNPNIRSYCDATGLMQIMPRDLTEKTIFCGALNCINGHCFADRPTIEELYDPAFNIDYGAGFLAKKYNDFGDWREALKAYGPENCGYDYADKVLTIFENYK